MLSFFGVVQRRFSLNITVSKHDNYDFYSLLSSVIITKFDGSLHVKKLIEYKIKPHCLHPNESETILPKLKKTNLSFYTDWLMSMVV